MKTWPGRNGNLCFLKIRSIYHCKNNGFWIPCLKNTVNYNDLFDTSLGHLWTISETILKNLWKSLEISEKSVTISETIWNSLEICEHIWKISEWSRTSLENLWTISEKSLKHLWKFSEHLWKTCETFLKHIWNISEKSLKICEKSLTNLVKVKVSSPCNGF